MNIVLNCDCMAFMSVQKDCFAVQGKKWDFKGVLAILDPQTGQGEDGGKNRRGKVHKKKNWDKKRMPKEWIDKIFRITENQIIWQAEFYLDYLYPSMGCIVWDKKVDNSHYSDFEFAWSSFKRGKKIFRYNKNGGTPIKGRFIHPCQKPVALYKWLLKNYATPGQLIFDSHVGSGSLRIACYDMGFDFIGCELDYDYWQSQEERYKNYIANQELILPEEIQEAIWKQGMIENRSK